MKSSRYVLMLWCSAALFAGLGCDHPRGKPGAEPEVPRPDSIVDFKTLYGQNCIACHGDNRQTGAAISLANPAFLAVAGEENLRSVIASGVPGKLMPAFAKSAGGTLTDEQVEILAKGLISTWGKADMFAGQTLPPYKAVLHGDAVAGQTAFAANCAGCHGASGGGGNSAGTKIGSIIDPSYLALISDQELRNIVIAGMPGMPDWRSDSTGPAAGHTLTDAEITNIVTWLGSHRASAVETKAAASDTASASTSQKIKGSASQPAARKEEPTR